MAKKVEAEKDGAHDFNAPVGKTSTELAKMFLVKLSEHKDVFIVDESKELTPEENATMNEALSDFLVSYMQLISTTDLPADYISWPITKIMATLNIFKTHLEGKLREIEDEYLCRSLAVRSPKTGTFAKDCITVGEYMLKLDEVRQKTGNDPKDYIVDYK